MTSRTDALRIGPSTLGVHALVVIAIRPGCPRGLSGVHLVALGTTGHVPVPHGAGGVPPDARPVEGIEGAHDAPDRPEVARTGSVRRSRDR